MQHAALVNVLQTFKNRADQRHRQPRLDPGPNVGQVVSERQTFVVVHDQIRSAVVIEVAAHPDNVGMIQPRHDPRLAQKLVLAELERRAVIIGMRNHLQAIAGPGHHIAREILLDRDTLLQMDVPPEIGDAEAPWLAEHFAHAKLGANDDSVRQIQRRTRLRLVVPALWADRNSILLRETAWTVLLVAHPLGVQ